MQFRNFPFVKTGRTFCRVCCDPGLVETLLVAPVSVPLNGFGSVQQHQCHTQSQQYGPAPISPQPDAQCPCASCYQQAEAHARDVEHPLGDNKPHIKEEVSGRDEGQCHHGQ